jgi:hypothetical protein
MTEAMARRWISVVAVLVLGVAGVYAVKSWSRPSPAATLAAKISGCVYAVPLNNLDDNAVAGEGCVIEAGVDDQVSLYVWPTSDPSAQQELEDYVYHTAQDGPRGCSLTDDPPPGPGSIGGQTVSGTECIIGRTGRYLWFVELSVEDQAPHYAATLAPGIARMLGGHIVSTTPLSWCTGGCYPVPWSPPTPARRHRAAKPSAKPPLPA